MFWNRKPEVEEPTGPGLTENLRSLLASAAGYIRARAELLGIESKEAIGIYGAIIALVVIAAVFLFFGYIFLWVGLIAVSALLTGLHWGWIALIVALLHFIGTAVCLAIASQRWGQPVFTATLNEFKKDQQWLSHTTPGTNGRPV